MFTARTICAPLTLLAAPADVGDAISAASGLITFAIFCPYFFAALINASPAFLAEFKSLNLSHSLIIIAQYVSSIIKLKTSYFKKSKKVKAASKKEIHAMTNLCIKNLDEINFFKPKEKKPIMLENLRNIFYKMELSAKETRILASVFASLGKKR